MNRTITALTVLTVSLGTAACAGTTSPTLSSAASPTSAAAPASNVAYTSQSSNLNGSGLAMNSSVPGATGYTIVPGDNSTIAGDAAATAMMRAGSFSK